MDLPLARAALYLRISKDDARTGLAVERQRSECLKVIEREELTLVETYADNGVSAYNRNVRRPEFDRMTRDYEAGRFDVVVTWDLDRFSRQPVQLERWIEMGEARGLRIITPSETTDLGNDNGRAFARIKAAFARAEVERKSARQKAQVAQAKELGTFKGRIGFDDPVVIRRIFALVLAGEGVYKIAKQLTADGLTTSRGVAWSGQAVRGIVRTPRHRGGLIAEADYDAARALVSVGQRVGPKAKGLYSGVARCTSCGAAMTASGDRYKCSYATNHPGAAGHVTVLRRDLEPRIDAAMVSAFTFGRRPSSGESGEVVALDAELARVAQSRKRLSGLVAADLLSVEDASTDLRALKAEADALTEKRTAALEADARARMLDGLAMDLFTPGPVPIADVVALKVALAGRWTALGDEERRKLAREYLEVVITPQRGAQRVAISHRIATDLNGPDEENQISEAQLIDALQ